MPNFVHFHTFIALLITSFFFMQLAPAASSMSGQTGLLMVPDGRIDPDGTVRVGFSRNAPYQTGWLSFSMLPWLEATGGFTEIQNLDASDDPSWDGYGNFKDKNIALKLRLVDELGARPSIAIGIQDPEGTGLFKGRYFAASKQIGPLDLTLGYGDGRYDGLFGGLRYTTPISRVSLVAEYDGIDYRKDIRSTETGVADRKHQINYGLEYQADWWTVQASRHYDGMAFNMYLHWDLEKKEFLPKHEEPPPYLDVPPRPTEAMWQKDKSHQERLIQELYKQEFRDVDVAYASSILEIQLTHRRISDMSRAVGRSVRVALALSPRETRAIQITYTDRNLPLATYSFSNLQILEDYFGGLISRAQFSKYVKIEYPEKSKLNKLSSNADFIIELDKSFAFTKIGQNDETGDLISLSHEDVGRNMYSLRPALQTYLNDPSGAFRYDLSAIGTATRRLTPTTEVVGQVKLTISESISGVQQASNSALPHVRSDAAEYKAASNAKIYRLLINDYYHLSQRQYARLSAGIYEEMFTGIGGQWLYLPETPWWAFDVAVDGVKQREYEGKFGLASYETITAIGSLHIKAPYGVNATLRAGRFLAGDEGVRIEASRRFRSGIEFGAWYSVTNGNDITNPGTPDNPYHDKGIFLTIPLSGLSLKDNRAEAGIALSPWSRDVGQMVTSPADLYGLVDKTILSNTRIGDGLSGFADVDDDYQVTTKGISLLDRPFWSIVGEDVGRVGSSVTEKRFWGWAAVAGGITLVSSTLDSSIDRLAREHGSSNLMNGTEKLGDLLPIAAMGFSGLVALSNHDQKLSQSSLASLEAGTAGLVIAMAGKYAIGRMRPEAELGASEFNSFNSANGDSSFPSIHTTVAWAAITPYAKAYHAPWLYGVAALTNVARVSSRKHWFSDTVGGSILGYALGNLFWENRNLGSKAGPQIYAVPNEIGLKWRTP